jgi:hypothetical protein
MVCGESASCGDPAGYQTGNGIVTPYMDLIQSDFVYYKKTVALRLN